MSSFTSRVSIYLVDRRFFCSRSKYPLTVASTFGRSLEIRLPARPDQEVKWLHPMARRKVIVTWLKHDPLRHWASFALVVSIRIIPLAEGERTLLILVKLIFFIGIWLPDFLTGFFRGIFHKPLLFLGQVMITLLFLIIFQSYLVNRAIQSPSQSWTTETRDPVLGWSKMKVCYPFLDNSSDNPQEVWRMGAIVFPFATLTSGPPAGEVS